MKARKLSVAVSACCIVALLGLSPITANAVDSESSAATGDAAGTPLDPKTQPIIDSMADDRYQKTVRMIQDAGINELNPEFAGTVLLDGAVENQLTLRYYKDAPTADEVLRIVDELNREAPLKIVLEPTSVHIGHLEEVALELIDPEGISRENGIYDVTGATYDMRTGKMYLTTSDRGSIQRLTEAEGAPELEYKGLTVQVQYEERNPEAGFQASRNNDSAPWSGGIHLKTSSSMSGSAFHCTSGFNWKKWSTGELMGSTAEHCLRGTGVSTWYNAGTRVGSRYYYNVAADAFLMRSVGGNSKFASNMFLGGQNTAAIRSVVGDVTTNQAGKAVALNSGRGLQPAVTVLAFKRVISTSWGDRKSVV